MAVYPIVSREDQVFSEGMVGGASNRICYPGITTCITITGAGQSGLVGAHVSVDNTTSDLDQMLQLMLSSGGANFFNWYVVGNIARHKALTKSDYNKTRKILGVFIRSQINKSANVWFYDVSSGEDYHIYVQKSSAAAYFRWATRLGNATSHAKIIDPVLANVIAPADMVLR